MTSTDPQTQCAIVGGGPAGVLLGVLLARAGIETVVLEKHGDFLRDFRGDTVHPSTLQVMADLGVLDGFLDRPHQELRTLTAEFGGERIPVADFSHLPTAARFLALMPQWEFLDFLAGVGRRYPEFDLQMQTAATGLLRDAAGRVVGVEATTPDGPLRLRAGLVVGADGRGSGVRGWAGLSVDDLGAPMDVFWMRLPREPDDADPPLGRFDAGHIVVMLPRDSYYQCAYVIPKGAAEAIRAAGIEAFRQRVAEAAPVLRDRVDALRSWDDVKLLSVRVDRLREWAAPGVLCIGDAAHAMSPIGGVGINLALQDAVAAANLLWEPLRNGASSVEDLRRVQERRELPVRLTQWAQVALQNRVIRPALAGQRAGVPLAMRALRAVPALRRIPARLVGMGARMERVRSPDVH